jgi:hypothetical protein
MKSRALIAIGLLAAGYVVAGCDNIGNENPVSPQQMEDIRKKQASERENYNPMQQAPPKPSN